MFDGFLLFSGQKAQAHVLQFLLLFPQAGHCVLLLSLDNKHTQSQHQTDSKITLYKSWSSAVINRLFFICPQLLSNKQHLQINVMLLMMFLRIQFTFRVPNVLVKHLLQQEKLSQTKPWLLAKHELKNNTDTIISWRFLLLLLPAVIRRSELTDMCVWEMLKMHVSLCK